VRFEWDPAKAAENAAKHGVSLEEAAKVFRDTSESSVPDWQPWARGRSMRKAGRKPSDGLRPEYKRADFGRLARGKYARRIAEATNVVVLDPQVAKAFPNDRAVNRALRELLRSRKSSPRPTTRSTRTRKPVNGRRKATG